MRFLLLTAALSTITVTACTPTTYDPFRDRPDYVDRVLEDVTAILEGMAAAHYTDKVVDRDPGALPRLN